MAFEILLYTLAVKMRKCWLVLKSGNSMMKRNLFYKCYMTLIKYSFDNLFWSSIFYTIHFEIQVKVCYKLDRFGTSSLLIHKRVLL